MRRARVTHRHLDDAPHDGPARVETLIDERLHRHGVREKSSIVGAAVRPLVEAEQTSSSRVHDLHFAAEVDDEQPGRQAGDDLLAEPFGGFGPKRHGAFLRLEVGDCLLQRHRQERRFGAALTRPRTCGPCGRKDSRDAEHQYCGERHDNRRQSQKHQASGRHGYE